MSGEHSTIGTRLFIWMQYLMPQHGLSRLVLKATRVRSPWFKNALVRGFLKLFKVQMSDAINPDPFAYGSFNEFFTRALKPHARPIDAAVDSIASPVDGAISELGDIEGDRLLQAKGQYYRLQDLLAGQPWAAQFQGGTFATIYLAPFNYHRIHMPLNGRLLETWYVPGRLFSVNRRTAENVPGLFARNERVVTLFDGPFGRFALVLVGALNVGSMATVWAGDITPARRRLITQLPPTALSLGKGEEVGRFNMGSTVILVFEPGRVRWLSTLHSADSVQLGQVLGHGQ